MNWEGHFRGCLTYFTGFLSPLITASCKALAAFGCNRKKNSTQADVQMTMVYGSVEGGDGENQDGASFDFLK